ncbi:hydroxyindole O-methyltransferase [Hypoxylon crocopeplum]|nr:hydroxyindole O-methyltransferase [Hypoxylon crocopeplum]
MEANSENDPSGLLKDRTQDDAWATALNPCDLGSISTHINIIGDLGTQLANGEDQVRLGLLKSARNLVRALETPRETMIRHCWAEPSAFIAIEIGIKIGLFRALSLGGDSKKASDLAQKLNVDPALVGRILRHLAAMGYITETGADEYKPTQFSSALNIRVIGDGYPLITECVRPAVDQFPKFLERTNYIVPTSATNSPYQYAHNTKLNMLEHLEIDPINFQRFHNHMGGYRQGRDSWMDTGFFPVHQRLAKGAESHPDAVFLVDVGGSLGHDLEEFCRKHPDVPGRLILQDLPSVLDQIQHLDERIERIAYDFYTEQPVKGSRAYFIHSVLHDWPDDICHRILARIREAMKPGYSKLLVYENVIPATGADWQATAEDLMVMITSSSLERSEDSWRALLEGAGFNVNGIWRTDNALESLIECELDISRLEI